LSRSSMRIVSGGRECASGVGAGSVVAGFMDVRSRLDRWRRHRSVTVIVPRQHRARTRHAVSLRAAFIAHHASSPRALRPWLGKKNRVVPAGNRADESATITR
jgi:hypothetical protein